MLNDIKFHINSDEKAQQLAERLMINTINQRFTRNKEALIRYVPSIGQKVEQIKLTRFSVFIDKNEQLNIVDFNSGRTLYTLGSDENIQHQITSWASNSAWLSVKDNTRTALDANCQISSDIFPNVSYASQEQKPFGYSFSQLQQYVSNLEKLQSTCPIDTFVCLGLGKATFLTAFLSLHKIAPTADPKELNLSNLKHLVCYEPSWEWFVSSLYAFDWADLLDYFNEQGLTLFLQIGTDTNLIFHDITELHHKLDASNILFYKHTNLPVFNNVIRNVRNSRWDSNVVMADKLELEAQHDFHYIQPFSSLLFFEWDTANTKHARLNHNLDALKEFYPDIYQAFVDYKPRCWQTIVNSHNGEVNLYNQYANAYFSNQNAEELLTEQAEYFIQNPSHDGLVLGYSSDKLKHYLHNSFIRQSDFILRGNTSKQEELPENIKVMMVLGLGNGQLLQKIQTIREIQHLVVCEPNHDMFFASLFVVDWAKMIEHADKNEYHLYINIGESSNRLFKDVMSQFMQIGPHLLNETYILQSYENPLLSKMYYEVRQQLQVLFALGENFDHVAYGVAHTVQVLENNIPAMRFNPSQYLTKKQKQTPIFIVGNGPSLDENIEILKECREQVILVSCGTALQALHRNGITPDFHGEVEQNRANFDWVSRIGDFDYLKQITLISVNGIHPDSIKLYKNALFAFKAGESSTHTGISLFPKESFHIIEYAYPTVTNMALSFFLALGFEQMYLVGVDLGFASKTKHHSQSSGYYEQGKEIYNYEKEHSVAMKVRGNRQPWVYTKTEFNISRMLIEQLLQDPKHGLGKTSACFNLSNGVIIEGTVPLEPDSVLIVNDSEDKQDTLKQLQTAFSISSIDVKKSIAKAYSFEVFKYQQQELKNALPDNFASKQDIQHFTDTQTKLLKEAKYRGGSLFYYYFYNSVNASNALFIKAKLIKSKTLALKKAHSILDAYRVFLDDAKHMVDNYLSLIDVAGSNVERREAILIDINQKASNEYLGRYRSPTVNNNLELPILIPVSLVVDSTKSFETFQTLLASHQHNLIRLQRFNNDFSDLVWVESSTDMSNKRILTLLIENESSGLRYLEWLKRFVAMTSMPSKASKLNVVLVFSDFRLLNAFAESSEELIALIQLQYTPPSLTMMNEHIAERFRLGEQSGFDDNLWLENLVLRSQNFYLFNLLVNKPRFLKTGLEYASLDYASNENDNELVFEHSWQEFIATTDANGSGANLNPENKELTPPVTDKDAVITNNEFECKAAAHIQSNVLSQSIWAVPCTRYMFKHHLGVKFEPTSDECRPVTLLDKTNNRGLKLSRKPFAFELLGAWIDD